jgi:hypothetical protein
MSSNNDSSTRTWHELETAELLRREIDDAHRTIRALMRRLADEQEQQVKTKHAYEQMKSNIMEMNREFAMIERERDMWRQRAEHHGAFEWTDVFPQLTSDEISAIRRAMARLHHPDQGGDSNRMKEWNKILDKLDKKRK